MSLSWGKTHCRCREYKENLTKLLPLDLSNPFPHLKRLYTFDKMKQTKDSIAKEFANLAHFPEAAADAPDGKYVIRMDETGEVGSFGPKIEYSNWFKTPVST